MSSNCNNIIVANVLVLVFPVLYQKLLNDCLGEVKINKNNK